MLVISTVYNFLWGDLFTISLPGGSTIGISLLVLILIPAGIFFTIRTKFLPVRYFPEMLRIALEKQTNGKKGAISGLQALIVSTATRVGMGNMVGVVAAISAGGFGAALMNGVKRGLFSNEAGSGSAPCAAAAANVSHPVKSGLFQAFGVFIDTIVICSCTAMIMLLAPAELLEGLSGMELLQTAMYYHFGSPGVVFIAITLWLFSFSTFIGILFYARSNVAYLFGDNWVSQTAYKILALVMLFIGGLAAYTFVWDLGDIGVGLMTIFNMIVLIPMSGEAIASLKNYEKLKKHS